MRRGVKSHINKVVGVMSIISGIGSWVACRYLYTTYHEQVAGPVLIAGLCSFLFTAVFLTVFLGSKVTGSFDENCNLYKDGKQMLLYFLGSLAAIFVISMFLEFIYEINPKTKQIEPTSYIFVIDESGSMSGNDPSGLRYEAIPEIMKAEETGFPYMVYTFSNDTQIVRNMGPLEPDYEDIPVNSNGGTAIRGTILKILQDYKDGVWEGGDNPKVIFLTDGDATDINSGFLWFKGDMPEFNAALEEYKDLDINISTVGLGTVDRDIMTRMAETTGGVFVHIQDASDLASAMKTAATSYSDRDLLSIRYMNHLNVLYGFLRVLFLTIIGAMVGSLMLLAYMEESSIPLIIVSSIVSSLISSILFEIGLKIGSNQSVLWLILWGLFSLTLGLNHPKTVLECSDNWITVCTTDCYLQRK